MEVSEKINFDCEKEAKLLLEPKVGVFEMFFHIHESYNPSHDVMKEIKTKLCSIGLEYGLTFKRIGHCGSFKSELLTLGNSRNEENKPE